MIRQCWALCSSTIGSPDPCGFAIRQLSNIHRDPSRLILRQQLRRRAPPWLILIADVGRVLAMDKIAARLRYSVTQRD